MKRRPQPAGYGGFVLAGGASTRMGRDKALLSHGETTLLEHVASQVAAAAGGAVIIGPPDRYRGLRYPVVADRTPGLGPLGGIQTALRISGAPWNLVVACDMPELKAEFLSELLAAAVTCGGDCLVPVPPSGRMEPLCAVYGRECLPRIEEALRRGVRAVHAAIAGPPTVLWPVADERPFRNLNAPEDLAAVHDTIPASSGKQ
jgi:molybdopterin-guanine dinucleotide biosynthesis protein A